jgi:hypothetical protein
MSRIHELEAENARYRQALEHIAANGCERLTGDRKTILCKKNYIKGAPYGSDAWCDACWAMEALGTEPLVPAISQVGAQRIRLADRIKASLAKIERSKAEKEWLPKVAAVSLSHDRQPVSAARVHPGGSGCDGEEEMKLHERTMKVQAAHCVINSAITDAVVKIHATDPDLTYIELLGILNQVSASWLKHALREERHPDDPDARADEE